MADTQPLYILLRRAMDDGGAEGDNAWDMFVKRAKKQQGRIYFLDDQAADPLMAVVRDQDEEIAFLKSELDRMQKAFHRIERTAVIAATLTKRVAR